MSDIKEKRTRAKKVHKKTLHKKSHYEPKVERPRIHLQGEEKEEAMKVKYDRIRHHMTDMTGMFSVLAYYGVVLEEFKPSIGQHCDVQIMRIAFSIRHEKITKLKDGTENKLVLYLNIDLRSTTYLEVVEALDNLEERLDIRLIPLKEHKCRENVKRADKTSK